MHHQDRQMTALPVCPPDNGEVVLFPKPENCSEFYQCAGGVAFTHHCPENLYYCEEKQYCAWIAEPGCKFDCVITKTNPAPAAKKYVPAAAPVCPPQIDEEVTYFPNPDNCNMYYECSNEEAIPMECPDDLYFCTQKQSCDWIWDPDCTYNCVAVQSKPVRVEEKFEPVCPEPTDNLTLIANPENCSSFYGCDNGVPVPMGCPGGLYFCTEKQSCAWIWDPECTYDCVAAQSKPVRVEEKFDPVCPEQTENVTFIANPENCSSFYECDNGVPVPMGCPGGLYFCTERQLCSWVWDEECTFNCVAVKTIPFVADDKFNAEPIDETAQTDEPTFEPEKTTPRPTANPICPPVNGDEVIYTPNHDDCSAYYQCSNGVALPLQCPGDLYFCSQKNTCAWIWEPDCIYDCVIVKK
jgi:hypothetical protein